MPDTTSTTREEWFDDADDDGDDGEARLEPRERLHATHQRLAETRARFDRWRHDRPFLGGALLLLAGLVIAYVPMQFATELLLVGGSFTFIGLLFAVLVALTGVFALMRPDLSRELGILGVAMSILSIFGALGGLVVGMLVGIVGGNLCIAWDPSADEEPATPSSSSGATAD